MYTLVVSDSGVLYEVRDSPAASMAAGNHGVGRDRRYRERWPARKSVFSTAAQCPVALSVDGWVEESKDVG